MVTVSVAVVLIFDGTLGALALSQVLRPFVTRHIPW